LHLWLAFISNRDHIFYCLHGGEQLHPMMLFEMPLLPSQKTRGFTFYTNKSMSFHLLPFSFFQYWVDIVLSVDDIYTLIMLLLIPIEQNWFCVLFHLVGWLLWWMFMRRKFFYQDQHLINALFPILLYLDTHTHTHIVIPSILPVIHRN
jgi:hypothetical protein